MHETNSKNPLHSFISKEKASKVVIQVVTHSLKSQNDACSTCKCMQVQTCFSVLCQHTSLHKCGIAWVVSLRKSSQPTTKATGCEILLYVVSDLDRSQCISQERQVGFEQTFTRPLSMATETTITKLNERSITSNNYLRTLK